MLGGKIVTTLSSNGGIPKDGNRANVKQLILRVTGDMHNLKGTGLSCVLFSSTLEILLKFM